MEITGGDSMSIDEITTEALKLNPASRARLARELLASLDTLSAPDVEQLWIEEAARRDGELDQGTARLQPADEVLARARARLG
jgi:Putative addiction module component